MEDIRKENDKLFNEEESKESEGICPIDQNTRDLILLELTESKINKEIKKKIENYKKKKKDFMKEINEIYGLDENELAVALGDKEIFKNIFLKPYYSDLKLFELLDKKTEKLEEDAKNIKNIEDSQEQRMLKAKINKFTKEVNDEKKKKIAID